MSSDAISKLEIVYKEARANHNTDILTLEQAMSFLQVSKSTLYRIVADKKGLNPVKIGGRLRFPLMNLIEYSLDQRAIGTKA